jgi:hypothetical protein
VGQAGGAGINYRVYVSKIANVLAENENDEQAMSNDPHAQENRSQ